MGSRPETTEWGQQAEARARYVRVPPRKARAVCAVIQGKPVGEAMVLLRFLPQQAAGVVGKVLRSAIANAVQNLELDPDGLYVASATADQGPVSKRVHPRARGRPFPILKRTSHVTVVVRQRNVT